MIDASELEALRELSELATPGPWRADGRVIWQATGDEELVLGNMPRGGTLAYNADVAFMVAAANVVRAAALTAAADAPQPAEPMTLSCVPTGCQCSCHRSGGLHGAHIVACCNPSPAVLPETPKEQR